MNTAKERLPLKFKRHADDPDCYAVSLYDAPLGDIYYDSEAWRDERWFILGEPKNHRNGGVNHATRKPSGYSNRYFAAKELARMGSALILKAVNNDAD